MATVTVRIPQHTHERLARLAREEHRSLGDVIADAIDRYEREAYFRELGAAFARLRADPEAWADYQAELALWDNTLLDGLEDDPWIE